MEFTGLRPGEKPFEEPLADGERTLPTPHARLRVARAAGVLDAEALAPPARLAGPGRPGDR
jgi:FlaA1/EpsC-like NDP-sugar epimerase